MIRTYQVFSDIERSNSIMICQLLFYVLPMVTGDNEPTTAQPIAANYYLPDDFFPENDRDVARVALKGHRPVSIKNNRQPPAQQLEIGMRRFMEEIGPESDQPRSSVPRRLAPMDFYEKVPPWTKSIIHMMPQILSDLASYAPGLHGLVKEHIIAPMILVLGTDVCSQVKRRIAFNDIIRQDKLRTGYPSSITEVLPSENN